MRRAFSRNGLDVRCALLASAVIGVVCGTADLDAQSVPSAPDSVVVAPGGERYDAGSLWRTLFGRQYRDIWSTPIRIEVLDLQREAGGLVPTRTGGGLQTRSLRFDGADGLEYRFRSIDKTPVLDSLLEDTFIADLVQDEISATHPYGALVADPLMAAVGVLHASPRLVSLPDDPGLAEFREEFAGLVGLLEVHPDEVGDRRAFEDARLVISSERLVERLDEGPDDRVSSEAFLRARLMDFLLGDWDRHRDQWRWATYDSGSRRSWLPIARDRDQVFYRYDGVALRLLSLYRARFVRFDDEYPAVDRLHWQARDIDWWFLADLERDDFGEVAHEIRNALTDPVVEAAVQRLPPEIYATEGAELTRILKARRDGLASAADAFYELLAQTVEVRATDADDEARVTSLDEGRLRLELHEPGASAPYWSRTFDPEETTEVRLRMRGGDDRVVLDGDGASPITVRVLTGAGHDAIERVSGEGTPRVYDADGTTALTGLPGVSVDESTYPEWVWRSEDRIAPRESGDWTFPVFWSSVTPELGLFLGGGVRLRDYGFRKRPFASEVDIRAGVAPVRGKWRAQVIGRFHRENSGVYVHTAARVSRLDVAHYYGLGNATVSQGRSFHQVDLTSIRAALGIGVSSGPAFDAQIGAVGMRSTTRLGADRFIGGIPDLYGGGTLWQWGVEGRLEADPLVEASSPHRFRLRAEGRWHPELGGITSPMGSFGGDVTLRLATGAEALALVTKVGGKRVVGDFPWYEAAFVGGNETLRGWHANRFAGDGALFASGEVHLRLGRPVVVVPSRFGVFGFSDVGRVYLDGDSPGGWHVGVGGGFFLQPIGQPYLLRVGVGVGGETTTFSAALGLPY